MWVREKETPSLLERLNILPVLTILRFGFSLNTSIAIIEALIGKGGTFVRPPKLTLTNKSVSTNKISRAYLQPVRRIVHGELGLILYALLVIALLHPHLGLVIVPWLSVSWLVFSSYT